ncbi:MAG TPA: glycosyl hydrolase family 79 C-terminal domain-containing protein [Pseudonocardiaceae bacterium]|nr:glycosyl hydrolase family 79 C-terminal domain-containing protein [Pseudonocardiaceae bacterium]
MKTLGSSTVRIGGNTVDQTFWTSKGETAPSWSTATITPADLTALGNLARASGWKVILGVNLKHLDAARAGDEAAHAVTALGSSLRAIEIGNEPDLYPQYSSNTNQFFTDFQSYVAAINKAAPGVAIVGSDAAGAPNGSFQNAFASKEKALGHPNIAELTGHFYPLVSNTCGGNPTISDLLGTTTRNAEKAVADNMVTQAKNVGVPGVFDEGNSVVCEGQQGVSNVYASALWEIDDQLVISREGAAGDYEHGTVVQCGSAKPLYMFYTPLCAATAADATAGNVVAQPEYYGMAAVQQIGDGTFVGVDNPVWATLRGYAITHPNGTLTVVLDNLRDSASNGATTVQLALGGTYHSGTRVNLTAGSLTATTGITLGGQTVAANGTLHAPTTTPVTVNGTTLNVTVNAGSAAFLTLSH